MFGELLAAAGDVERASLVWRMVLARPDQEAGVHRHMAAKLETLAPASGDVPTLDEVLRDLRAYRLPADGDEA